MSDDEMLTRGMMDVLAERARQRAPSPRGEGFDAAHDKRHSSGELARAAACYATNGGASLPVVAPAEWPWDAATS